MSGVSGRLCLVTDRRRLLAALDRRSGDWQALLLQQIEGAVSGGVDHVQIRENDLDGRMLIDLVRQVLAVARGKGAKVIVNDRLDVAVAADADGVHLPERGLTPEIARRLAPGRLLLGRSVHQPLALAPMADYFIAGTVFATASKERGHKVLGLDGLRAVVGAAGDRPVWAIGGVTAGRVAAVRATGAAGIAVTGALIPEQPTGNLRQEVCKLAERLRFAFDSLEGQS